MRPPRRWRAALAALIVLGSVVTFSGADARTATNEKPTAPISRAQALRYPTPLDVNEPVDPKYGIPAAVVQGPESTTSNTVGLVEQSTTKFISTTVARAKTTVSVPRSTLLAFVRTCATGHLIGAGFDLNTCCPQANANLCPSNVRVDFPNTSDDFGPNQPTWNYADGPVWVSSQGVPEAKKPFGTFPAVRISLLAFGSIPVTATLHISQAINSNGGVAPLRYRQLVATGAFRDDVVAGYPMPNPFETASFFQYVDIRGPIDITIDDVRVDGEPLNVGNSCRTATPAILRYEGPRGWADQDNNPVDRLGRPGEFVPIGGASDAVVGRLHGSVDLPAFAGCRDGHRDLSPLVSSLASGAGNHLELGTLNGFKNCQTLTSPGSNCVSFPQRLDGAQGSQPAGALKAGARVNSPRVSRTLVRVLAKLPPGQRAAILPDLPKPLSAAVRAAAR